MNPRRRDADDGEGRAIERQRLADDRRVASQAALPEAMADDHDRRRLLVVFGREPAAERRLDAEQREVVAGDHLRRDLLRLGPAAPVQLREGERRHPGEHLVLVAEVLVVEMRERQVARVALVEHEDRHQPVRLGHGHRLQQDDVDHAEDRGVRADAEREGERRDDGEGRALRQHAKAVAQVLEHKRASGGSGLDRVRIGQFARLRHSWLVAGPHPRDRAWGPTPTRRPASGRLLLTATL